MTGCFPLKTITNSFILQNYCNVTTDDDDDDDDACYFIFSFFILDLNKGRRNISWFICAESFVICLKLGWIPNGSLVCIHGALRRMQNSVCHILWSGGV